MRATHTKQYLSSFFFLILILLTGCQPVNSVLENTPSATATLQALTPTVAELLYPSTPEEVIRAFLITYPVDQVYAIQYLSPNYVKDLDADSVSKLLPGTGEIIGFIIESGSSSSESEESEILVNIAFQDLSSEITFSLEIVDGRWVIRNIQQK